MMTKSDRVRRGWPGRAGYEAGVVLIAAVGSLAAPVRAAVPAPSLPDLTGIVTDSRSAIALGKALFWDQQAGSAGNACASCHFHAGADTRLTNQLSPGFTDITKGPNGDTAFGSTESDTGTVPAGDMPSGVPAGPDYTLTSADFPLHLLSDETDRNSPIVTTTNDRVSSQGMFDQQFQSVLPLGLNDLCGPADGTIFHAGAYPARQVEPRNTPSTINAVFNQRQFWDGRANNMFNGVGVFGARDILGDPNMRLIVLDAGNNLQLGSLQLNDASLASQAVGPPTSFREMSCNGRTFRALGRKMLLTIPLLQQKVAKDDSVLGPYASKSGQGLAAQYLYAALISKAFDKKYWASPGLWDIVNGQLVKSKTGYTQMETNFSMFWGISIMLYESTLVSGQSEYDSLIGSGDLVVPSVGNINLDCQASVNVDPLLARGCKLFNRFPFGPPPADGVRGVGCAFCHGGPIFTEIAKPAGTTFTPFLTPVPDVNGVLDVRDNGFANIGVRPVWSDPMVGGTDPYGNPLSYGRQYKSGQVLDPFLQAAIADGVSIQPNIASGAVSKLETDGASKIPGLRNVALTPPYFSWGGYSNLRQVMKVYNRGLSRRDIHGAGDPNALGSACTTGDSSGSGPDGNQPWPVATSDCNTNTTGLAIPLGLKDCDANGTVTCPVETDDLSALVRFMKSLTDPRVQCDQAPFDHPSLKVLTGAYPTDVNHDGKADDQTFVLPEVGAGGYAASSGFCIPNAGDLFAPGMQARSGGARVSQ